MSTKFLFPDWENEDDDSQDLCGRMREMAEEAARRERQGLPEKKEPEPPAPTAKSPRKRANFFSDLVEQIAKAKILLFTEDGEPFAYDEELGCYQPIPQLTAWLCKSPPQHRGQLSESHEEPHLPLYRRCISEPALPGHAGRYVPAAC